MKLRKFKRVARRLMAPLALVAAAASAQQTPAPTPAPAAAIEMAQAQKPSEMFVATEAENVQIFLGESYKLNVRNVEKIVISDPEIVEVVPVSTEVLVLNAKKAGTTILTLFEEAGERQVRVLVAHNDLALAMRIKGAIGYPNVNVLIAEENIILEGEVEDQDERNRAVSVASAFLAAIRPSTARTAGAANVYNTTQFPPSDNTSEGDVADANAYTLPTPSGILDFLRVRNQKQVRIRVVVVALTKAGQRDFGINFADTVNYGVAYGENIPGPSVDSIGQMLMPDGSWRDVQSEGNNWLGRQTRFLGHGTFNEDQTEIGAGAYSVQLRLLERRGDAKILAKPVLVTLDGAEASFLAGGKVVLTTSGLSGGLVATTTQTEEFGVKVFFRPKIMSNGNINMFITPKVAEIPTQLVQGFNSWRIDSRNTRNNVEVRTGDTIVLSGLFRVDESLTEDKAPWIGQIPIIGWMFKNKNHEKGFEEIMFLVTPEIVNSPMLAAVDGSMETELGETKALMQRERVFSSMNPDLASKGPKFEPRQYAATEPLTLGEAERTAREARGQAGPYTVEEIPMTDASPKVRRASYQPKRVEASPATPPPAPQSPVGTVIPIPLEEAQPLPAPSTSPAVPAMEPPSSESPLLNLPRPVAPTLRPR